MMLDMFDDGKKKYITYGVNLTAQAVMTMYMSL